MEEKSKFCVKYERNRTKWKYWDVVMKDTEKNKLIAKSSVKLWSIIVNKNV